MPHAPVPLAFVGLVISIEALPQSSGLISGQPLAPPLTFLLMHCRHAWHAGPQPFCILIYVFHWGTEARKVASSTPVGPNDFFQFT
jgi:hypothetical protein